MWTSNHYVIGVPAFCPDGTTTSLALNNDPGSFNNLVEIDKNFEQHDYKMTDVKCNLFSAFCTKCDYNSLSSLTNKGCKDFSYENKPQRNINETNCCMGNAFCVIIFSTYPN